jgi:uncharacterized GH25 family protein
MHRLLACCLTVFALATTAGAHFVFIVPDKDGSTAKVVFSDDLNPDENVPISKFAATKLLLVQGDKGIPLDLKKGENCYDVKVPGKGVRVVQGMTEFGVLTKGKDKKETFLLRYHPRAVIGTPKEAMKPDAELAVEILPVFEDGKLRLLVASKGKPVADAEVNVLLPGDKKKATTDKKGLTDAFDAPGRYGAYVRHSEAKSGEYDGKKYDEIRNYATLVVDLPK